MDRGLGGTPVAHVVTNFWQLDHDLYPHARPWTPLGCYPLLSAATLRFHLGHFWGYETHESRESTG